MASPLLLAQSADVSEIQVDFVDAFVGCIKTDRADGMFTTVVCDEVRLDGLT